MTEAQWDGLIELIRDIARAEAATAAGGEHTYRDDIADNTAERVRRLFVTDDS
jgi:hypothetical protein